MNNKKIIERAESACKKWEEVLEDRRGYEHENWHCVNVKRYNDGLDREDLEKIAAEVLPDESKEFARLVLVEHAESLLKHNDFYWDWLRDQWEQLNYEIGDIVNLGMRDKPFDQIRTGYNWAKGKSILALGRSGGWACFQMDGEDQHEEIRDMIEDPETYTGEEIRREVETLEEKIKQCEEIKAFIKKFNDGLDFKYEVKFRMEEKAADLEMITGIVSYDNGGKSVDRYTIIVNEVPAENSAAYGMSDDPFSPAGFNQYIGDPGKLSIEALGSKVDFSKLPEEIRRAVARRIAE